MTTSRYIVSIEENANLLLHLLARKKRGVDVQAEQIHQETNLHPEDISDAVKVLKDRGHIDVPSVVAPPDYDFGFVSLTTSGRLKYESILKEKGMEAFPDLTVIKGNDKDPDFETLARTVRRSIENNEPEEGLDRLHTYLVKYMRGLCDKCNIQYEKNTPLHSLLGMYVRVLENNNLIEAKVTKCILKSTISVFDAFNNVRNEQSLAHANELLNREESLLIFTQLTSVIRFIESIEEKRATT